MPNNEFAGSMTYVSWVTAGGTQTVSVESRNFNYNPTIDFIEKTAGQDATRSFANSFKGGQASMEYTAQTDGTALITAMAEGTDGTLTWGPAGTATGKPKKVMAAKAMGIQESYPYADLAIWTLTWQQNGDRTDSTW